MGNRLKALQRLHCSRLAEIRVDGRCNSFFRLCPGPIGDRWGSTRIPCCAAARDGREIHGLTAEPKHSLMMYVLSLVFETNFFAAFLCGRVLGVGGGVQASRVWNSRGWSGGCEPGVPDLPRAVFRCDAEDGHREPVLLCPRQPWDWHARRTQYGEALL